MNRQSISLEVTRAFSHRGLPLEKAVMASSIEDPGFDPEATETFEVYRGRTWSEIANLLREERMDSGGIFDFFYLSPEAFCYYLQSYLVVGMENARGSGATRLYLEFAVDPNVHGLEKWERWVAYLTQAEIDACISALSYMLNNFSEEYSVEGDSHIRSALNSFSECRSREN